MRRFLALHLWSHGRGLALAVVATLALGVAALTTTFAIVNAALLREPPFPDASRLAVLMLERNPAGEPPRRERWSFARFERLRATQQSFDLVASFSPASVTLSIDGRSELAQLDRVSASYFAVFGVSAMRGRLFGETDDDPANPAPVAVIGHDLWTGRLSSDPDVVGRTVRLNGVPVTIVGVLPQGFSGVSGRSEIWIPRTMSSQVSYAEYVTTNQNFIPAIGRLKAGADLASARSELAVLGAAINRELPSDPDHPDERVTATAIPLNEARVDPIARRSVLVLLGAVALLHLLASANVVNLLLGRSAARRREHALRMALGSSTSRLFGLVLGEGFTLAAVGGLAGVWIAWLVTDVITPPVNLWSTRFGSIGRFDVPEFGGPEVAFGLAIALGTAALVAVAPAWLASRVDVRHGLSSGGRAVAAGAISLRRPSARGVVVAIEAALATLLVVGAGLLIDSVQRIRQVNVGVDPDRVLTFWVIPSEARTPPAEAPRFVARLLDAITAVPGVESASVDGGAPLSGSATTSLYIAGRPMPGEGQAPPITRHYVAPDHFRTLGIELLRGRTISSLDTADSPRVTVISDAAARRFWPGEDPIGRRVWFGSGSSFDSPDRSAEIVGIVSDVRYQPFDQPANLASFYTPYAQFTYAPRMVLVRAHHAPMSVLPGVREAVAKVDPELAMQEIRPMADLLSGSWARRRFDAMLFGGFGLAALVLAASGIFAVLAYSVETRRREFGIRIALGAHPGRLIRHVIGEGLAFPVAGLLVGAGAALAFSRVLQASLYETSPQDPVVLAGTIVLLLVACVAACTGPAWRATRADPIESLRAE